MIDAASLIEQFADTQITVWLNPNPPRAGAVWIESRRHGSLEDAVKAIVDDAGRYYPDIIVHDLADGDRNLSSEALQALVQHVKAK